MCSGFAEFSLKQCSITPALIDFPQGTMDLKVLKQKYKKFCGNTLNFICTVSLIIIIFTRSLSVPRFTCVFTEKESAGEFLFGNSSFLQKSGFMHKEKEYVGVGTWFIREAPITLSKEFRVWRKTKERTVPYDKIKAFGSLTFHFKQIAPFRIQNIIS